MQLQSPKNEYTIQALDSKESDLVLSFGKAMLKSIWLQEI
jgi:hypothetical protein